MTQRSGERTRLCRTDRPIDLGSTLGVLRRGGGDPTWRRGPQDALWRGIRTPDGPATLRLRQPVRREEVEASAWGPGAGWVLDSAPAMLGLHDDDTGFAAHHRLVREAARRFPGWRVPRTTLVLEALVPAVIEQKVTGVEAFGGFRRLVYRFGEPAPGPGAGLGLMVQPTAATWTHVPSWEWLQAGVSPQRSATVVRCAGYAGRLQECVAMSLTDATRRLRAVPGVGVWTAAETGQRALGDADSVSFGDYHVAKNIGWALVGHQIDDDELAELLEPYAGHRYRVQRLLELAGAFRPRRGPRMPHRTHLPV